MIKTLFLSRSISFKFSKDATLPAVETEQCYISIVGTLSDTVEVGVPLFNIGTGVGEGGQNVFNYISDTQELKSLNM